MWVRELEAGMRCVLVRAPARGAGVRVAALGPRARLLGLLLVELLKALGLGMKPAV